mmetsp:Transcript_11161/g.21583  ORF Transcript_11161/g.21583 Transcript_11161/m.21583 type:complete len:268 (-) Transcript_11161:274-1077(-)
MIEAPACAEACMSKPAGHVWDVLRGKVSSGMSCSTDLRRISGAAVFSHMFEAVFNSNPSAVLQEGWEAELTARVHVLPSRTNPSGHATSAGAVFTCTHRPWEKSGSNPRGHWRVGGTTRLFKQTVSSSPRTKPEGHSIHPSLLRMHSSPSGSMGDGHTKVGRACSYLAQLPPESVKFSGHTRVGALLIYLKQLTSFVLLPVPPILQNPSGHCATAGTVTVRTHSDPLGRKPSGHEGAEAFCGGLATATPARQREHASAPETLILPTS